MTAEEWARNRTKRRVRGSVLECGDLGTDFAGRGVRAGVGGGRRLLTERKRRQAARTARRFATLQNNFGGLLF